MTTKNWCEDVRPVRGIRAYGDVEIDGGACPLRCSRGTPVICATHSPILASLPGATILELGQWGIRETSWEDLDLVQSHRRYLEAPERDLRYMWS